MTAYRAFCISVSAVGLVMLNAMLIDEGETRMTLALAISITVILFSGLWKGLK